MGEVDSPSQCSLSDIGAYQQDTLWRGKVLQLILLELMIWYNNMNWGYNTMIWINDMTQWYNIMILYKYIMTKYNDSQTWRLVVWGIISRAAQMKKA